MLLQIPATQQTGPVHTVRARGTRSSPETKPQTYSARNTHHSHSHTVAQGHSPHPHSLSSTTRSHKITSHTHPTHCIPCTHTWLTSALLLTSRPGTVCRSVRTLSRPRPKVCASERVCTCSASEMSCSRTPDTRKSAKRSNRCTIRSAESAFSFKVIAHAGHQLRLCFT